MALPLLLGAAGLATGGLGALLGSGNKVEIPQWQGIDPTQVQKETIEGNLANAPAAQALAEKATLGGLEIYNKLLDIALPGARQQALKITDSLMRGEIPSDVQQSVLRSGAARSLGLGTGGSGFSRNLTARDLLLTSFQNIQTGFSMFGTLAKQYSPLYRSAESMGQFFTAAQRAQIGMENAKMQWERNLMAAQVKAQADPTMANIGNVLAQIGGGMAGASVSGLMQPSIPSVPTTTGVPGYNPGTMPYGGSATFSPDSGFGVYRSPSNQAMFDSAQSYYDGVNMPSSSGGEGGGFFKKVFGWLPFV